MKNKIKYLVYISNFILMGLICFQIFSYEFTNEALLTNDYNLDNRRFISYLQLENKLDFEEIISEEKLVEPKEESNVVIKEKEVQLPPQEDVKVEEEPQVQETIETQEDPLIETLTGNLVGYGPDCYGCTSMRTASGQYIGEGNIYYQDKTYGTVRIVAGDKTYPFGTIVRISNVDFYNREPFYAIVLDRGGDIGKDKKFLFDLLFASENDAHKLGKEVNVKFEILRLGY